MILILFCFHFNIRQNRKLIRLGVFFSKNGLKIELNCPYFATMYVCMSCSYILFSFSDDCNLAEVHGLR